MIESQFKFIDRNYSWPFAISIIAVLIVTELLPIIFGTGENSTWDWGFLYVTLRFVLLPFVCVIHIILNLLRYTKLEKGKRQLTEISSIIIPLGYLLLLYFYPLPLTAWN